MKRNQIGFACTIEWEETLISELRKSDPDSKIFSPAPGLIIASDIKKIRQCEPIFSRQWFPNIIEIKEKSVRDFVQKIGVHVDDILDHLSLPWTCFICTPDIYSESSQLYKKIGGRASLLESSFMERMLTFRSRAMKRFIPWNEIPEKKPGAVIQGVMVAPNSLWLSVSETFRSSSGKVIPFLWKNSPGQVFLDEKAPCRSYYKIEEAWKEAGIFPRTGETCVDIGAAPGGWAWAALKRGAKVVAVDAADLAGHVARHPNCEHIRDNGYAFMPSRQADWMFCDMIVKPMASLGLLERWLEANACRSFVLNVKFRGKDPSAILQKIIEIKERYNLSFLSVRHLFFDRNEITLVGRV